MRSSPIQEEELREKKTQQLIDDLIDTMRHAKGVGIAAPQVGYPIRLFIIEVRDRGRYANAEPYPLTIVANPQLVYMEEKGTADSWEGCLSVRGLRGKLPRFKEVHLRGQGREGEPIDLHLQGFSAIVAQHESDHLDGMVYVDRVVDRTTFCFEPEYEKYHLNSTTSD